MDAALGARSGSGGSGGNNEEGGGCSEDGGSSYAPIVAEASLRQSERIDERRGETRAASSSRSFVACQPVATAAAGSAGGGGASAAKRSGEPGAEPVASEEEPPREWRSASRSRPVNGDPASLPPAGPPWFGGAAMEEGGGRVDGGVPQNVPGVSGGAGECASDGGRSGAGAAAGAPPPPPPPPPSLAAEPRRDADGDGAIASRAEWTAALPAASSLKPAPLPCADAFAAAGDSACANGVDWWWWPWKCGALRSREAGRPLAGGAALRVPVERPIATGAHPPLIAAAAAAAVPPPAELLRGESPRENSAAPPACRGRAAEVGRPPSPSRGLLPEKAGSWRCCMRPQNSPASRRYSAAAGKTGCCRQNGKRIPTVKNRWNSFLRRFFSGARCSSTRSTSCRAQTRGASDEFWRLLERISRELSVL